MLFAENVNKSFGGFDLFKDVSFNIADGERTALVGPNGAGKTTLLRMLGGEDYPSSGSAGHRNGTLGYLKQESGFHPDNGLVEEMWSAFPDALFVSNRIKQIEDELANGDSADSRLVEESVELYERFSTLDGYEIDARVDRVLSGLGFKKTDRFKKCGSFSGGWRMRISLAKALVRLPDHLLLDEPTNHLDLDATIWLNDYLSNYNNKYYLIYLILVIIGGSFFSTSSGIRFLKIYSLFKYSINEILSYSRPKNIFVNKHLFSKQSFEISEVHKYFLSIIIFIFSLFFLTCLLTLSGVEFDNSFKLSILTLMNTVNSSMYGLNDFSFNNLHFFTKYYLIIFMVIGRIELLTLLIICKKFPFKN